jgi:hypothetical protein
MGNCSFGSFPEETLQNEFDLFMKECCTCSYDSYCSYWEFATIFSIYLQTHKCSNHYILLEWLKKYRAESDWDSLSYQFIYRLCEKGKLKRYGAPKEFPLLLGIRIDRLYTPNQYIII